MFWKAVAFVLASRRLIVQIIEKNRHRAGRPSPPASCLIGAHGCRLLLTLCIFVATLPLSGAQDTADALVAIGKLGGVVRESRTGGARLEVQFQLRGTELSDEGLRWVAKLKNLESLNLKGTKVLGPGLKYLHSATELRRLHLEQTAVDDESLQYIVPLQNLEYLNLYGTKITDRAVKHLQKLKRLRSLYVWQTKMTDNGISELQQALPELSIFRGVDLASMPSRYPESTVKVSRPKSKLKWKAVSSRAEAPEKSFGGPNTQVVFENKSKRTVKLYWIDLGGKLILYGEIKPGELRPQNSYARHVWLITDDNDTPLGCFIAEPAESLAEIPADL